MGANLRLGAYSNKYGILVFSCDYIITFTIIVVVVVVFDLLLGLLVFQPFISSLLESAISVIITNCDQEKINLSSCDLGAPQLIFQESAIVRYYKVR